MKIQLGRDGRILLWVSLGGILVILVGALFAPARVDNDLTPSSYNSGSAGTKAAYLLLEQLGYHVERLEESAAALDHFDAQHTTLILAETEDGDFRKEKPFLNAFLKRGGHVLASGSASASLLPSEHVVPASRIYTDLCYTRPQGLSALARAGQIEMRVPMGWDTKDAAAEVDQACGDDATVVHYPVEKGKVIWWSSPLPLSNSGLKEDPSLRLLLASVGPAGNTVIFDEYIHGAQKTLWETAAGTPVFAMGWQLAAVALLLFLSFGRRNGPLRPLATAPRTSPLEFAESMGDLYRRAGAVGVATGNAERRLMQFLEVQGGIPRAALAASPEIVAATVSDRFRYSSPQFTDDLRAAREAETNHLSPGSALELVKRIDRHIANLTSVLKKPNQARSSGEPRD